MDGICSVDGCENGRPLSRGLCQKHYVRWKKHGSTDFPEGSRSGRKIRWLRQNASFQGDECLIWPFQVGDNGRGVASLDGKQTSAPRIMCILAYGEPNDEALHAAHTCGNGHNGCVNPKHLRWATPQENEADKAVHGTLRRGSDINTSKLGEVEVREIRKALTDGVSGKVIAQQFGISPAMVSSIKLRRAWAWLE